MSWLFSRALMEDFENSRSSLELVEEFSAATCSDGEPYAPLSVMPTPHKFWRNDKTMEPSQLSRFGLTCAVLTDDHGEDLLTWYLEGFRVKTLALRGKAQESTESDQGSGKKWRESSVRYDLDTSSWKTHQCLWEEDLPWSSVTLPTWGMTRNGYVYQHPTLERPISVTGCGLWPTPRSCSAMAAKITPENSWSDKRYPNLETVVGLRMWPTPVASMSKGSSQNALTRKDGRDRSKDRLDHAIMASEGGHLNPEWVEWLMGWPIGWTDLKPLGTDRLAEWQQQHSIFSQGID